MNRQSLVSVAWIMLFMSAGAPGSPTEYTFIDLHSAAVGNASGGFGIGDGQQVGFGGDAEVHPYLWTGSAASAVNLSPTAPGQAWGVDGGKQVGWINLEIPITHAAVWSGTAASMIDINPPGRDSSAALAIHGDNIVGYAGTEVPEIGTTPHATLWQGPAHNFIDLHPAGFYYSNAIGVSANAQVGRGSIGQLDHALMWHGSADSVIDLHPAGYDSSFAWGMSDTQQVGRGQMEFVGRALLWSGSAQSVIDLHRDEFEGTQANDVEGGVQVGTGYRSDGLQHALAWSGSADSMIDLHDFVPPGFLWSLASGIDEEGNIVGFARTGREDTPSHAVMWVPVTDASPIPLPAGALAGGPVLLIALITARRRELKWSSRTARRAGRRRRLLSRRTVASRPCRPAWD